MSSILHGLKGGRLAHYLKSGTFLTTAGMRLMLGKSRTAHLLCSFASQLKVKERLEKEYLPVMKAFDQEYAAASLPHARSRKVWVCWFQGMENAPQLVKRCYQSLQEHVTDQEIILITEQNMFDYAQFPDYILEKWKKGQISNAHMSDLLRLELLIRHGGTWVDATVLFTGDCSAYPCMFDSDLFFFQMLPPGRGGHTHIISSWFLTACTNNHVLMAVQRMLYEYWKKNDVIADYFLFHDFIIIVLQQHPELWNKVHPMDTSLPSMVYYRYFEPYDEALWQHMCAMTPIHKLTFKVPADQAEIPDTFYRHCL